MATCQEVTQHSDLVDSGDGGAVVAHFANERGEQSCRSVTVMGRSSEEEALGGAQTSEKADARAAVVDCHGMEVPGGGAVKTGDGTVVDSATEAEGNEPDITDTRLIGLRIIPGISLRA